MKKVALIAVAVLSLNAGALLAGGDGQPTVQEIKPIQIVSWGTVPSEAMDAVKFLQYRPGFQITYLLEGADLVGVKEGSLFHSIDPDAGWQRHIQVEDRKTGLLDRAFPCDHRRREVQRLFSNCGQQPVRKRREAHHQRFSHGDSWLEPRR